MAAILLALLFLIYPGDVQSAEEFQIFDGRVYNGKYYPRIDIIEWSEPGKPTHMEFQTYWKGKKVDLSFELETKTGRKVMLVHYFIQERNEHLCRRVLAPGHFMEGFHIYRDTSDADMDNILVSMHELSAKPGRTEIKNPVKYAACVTDEQPHRSTASEGETPARENSASHQNVGDRTRSDDSAIRGKDAAVPFSDW